MKRLTIFIVLFGLLLNPNSSQAVIEDVQFETVQLEARYKELIAEFRCLVCQNQNLADSNADLAKDLRRKTAEMLRAGSSNAEIRQYMRDRYGDFVTYRPAFDVKTGLLWLAPIVLLLLVSAGVMRHIRRRQSLATRAKPSNDEAQRMAQVQKLLNDSTSITNKGGIPPSND